MLSLFASSACNTQSSMQKADILALGDPQTLCRNLSTWLPQVEEGAPSSRVPCCAGLQSAKSLGWQENAHCRPLKLLFPPADSAHHIARPLAV